MSKASAVMLKGDERTRAGRDWLNWMNQASKLRERFAEWSDDLDPLRYNETASVALMANAAATAGYLVLTEYVEAKRHSTRGRPYKPGRCDLWLADAELGFCWALEFKQNVASRGMRQTTFDGCLRRAYDDARHVDSEQSDLRCGCLVLLPPYDSRTDPELVGHFDKLCAESDDAELAFRLGGGKFGPAWIVLEFV